MVGSSKFISEQFLIFQHEQAEGQQWVSAWTEGNERNLIKLEVIIIRITYSTRMLSRQKNNNKNCNPFQISHKPERVSFWQCQAVDLNLRPSWDCRCFVEHVRLCHWFSSACRADVQGYYPWMDEKRMHVRTTPGVKSPSTSSFCCARVYWWKVANTRQYICNSRRANTA